MKVLHANSGAGSFIRQTALAYHEEEILSYFLTTFISHQDYFLSNLIGRIAPNIKNELQKKEIPEIPFNKIKTYPYKELLRLFSSRYANVVLTDKVFNWAEHSFGKWVANQINQLNIDVVHSYEYSSLEILEQAKQNGVMSIYEQPSVYYKTFEQIIEHLFKEEKTFKEEYQSLHSSSLSKKRNQRREQEIQLADLIICNSTFTKNSFPSIYKNKVAVIPLGFPIPLKTVKDSDSDKVIFVMSGNISYLKGSHHVLRIWRKVDELFPNAELRVIGTYLLDEKEKQDLPSSIKFYARLAHQEYLDFINQADVFISFTYADGFGMVISEAMSKGIPVITTQNSMAPDFIVHQKNGWIVPVGEEEALLNQMRWCVENKHSLPKIGYEALQTAKKWQWEDYRKRTAEVVKNQFLMHNEQKKSK